MTDLTEQWHKGELQNSGWYYVKCLCENEDRIDYYNASFGCWTSNDKYIKEVIALVPSYEEWKASYNCMLENEVLRLKNAQLKELLKDARNVLKMVDTYYGDYDSTKGFLIVERIDEVLR